ncbi:hypothetical protein GCM10008957_34240 [Deinococcus ruber]|uniref:Uncharacterized protein n=1 Tax=Deinococcus ruber TaxID=1848197 RepID=A0A918FBF7_9DEIO|nr:hypothetical protein GCM10008957_34240 [Deinococcus ruber]
MKIQMHGIVFRLLFFQTAAGIHDQHVEPTELALHLVRHEAQVSVVGNVGLNQQGPATNARDFLGHLFSTRAFAAVIDDDICAPPGKLLRDAGSNSPRSTRDEHYLIQKVSHLRLRVA